MAIYVVESTSSGNTAIKKSKWRYNASPSSKWTYCFRFKDPKKGMLAAQAALSVVGNKHLKYSRSKDKFKSLPKALSKHNWNMKEAVNSGGTFYASCTPFIMSCVQCAGIHRTSGTWAYAGYAGVKKKLGGDTTNFRTLTDKDTLTKGKGLQVGDILLCEPHGLIVVQVGDSKPNISTTATSSTSKPVARKATCAEDVRKGAVAWAKAIAADNSFHYGESSWAHHGGCYFCNTNTRKKGSHGGREKKTYCCNPFVFSAYAHGGGDAHMKKLCRQGSNAGMDWNGIHKKDWARKRFKPLGNPTKANLIAGDVLCKYGHQALYAGDGYIVEATGGDDGVQGSKRWNNSIRCTKSKVSRFTHAYRYIGTGGDVMEMPDGSYYSSSGEYNIEGYDNGSPIVLEKETETLYSSDNYKWLEKVEEEEETYAKRNQTYLKNVLTNISFNTSSNDSSVNIIPTDVQVSTSMEIDKANNFKFKPRLLSNVTPNATLTSYPNFVEAPYIEISFNGIVIGGYGNTGDKYPNYITSLSVQKINGKINTYNISIAYQVRAGEDPNFLDSLLSKVGYTNPLKIRYGDSSSPSLMFKEESAVVTDVKYNEDVASSLINYQITAISSIVSANNLYFTYGTLKSKPSTVIHKLLYSSSNTQLLDAFPAMKNKTLVSSKNLIPNNDMEVTIGGMSDVSPLTYLGHLVSCMTNSNDSDSSYFLSYIDDYTNGSYFKITEVSKNNNTGIDLYTIDVGYPGDNFVTDFQLCDNIYWPLVYEYNEKIPKYQYGIDDNGNVLSTKSNPLYSDNKYLNDSIINTNWWKSITEFPISAKITLKGLTVPVLLMTYIRINTMFYGQKDMASGLYVVTDQTDNLSANGYTTTLTLLRVGN